MDEKLANFSNQQKWPSRFSGTELKFGAEKNGSHHKVIINNNLCNTFIKHNGIPSRNATFILSSDLPPWPNVEHEQVYVFADPELIK